MAETKSILLKVDVQGNKELERLQANFDASRRQLKALTKAERDGTKTAKQINAERARGTTQLHANRNALNDQRAALLKNNNALRKNSGFVAGVRKGVGQWATSMIGVTVAIAAVTKLVGSAVKIFKDFEQANSKLEAITKSTTSEMKAMSDQAKTLGSTSKFTASEITGLQIEFAKLGFPTRDIVLMTEATSAGAAALGSDLGEQAALTGALLKQFGLEAVEAARVNDVLAQAAASSALDFGKLSTALPIVGATANAVGVDLERATSLLGTLSDRGLDASTSGTALRNVFLELSKQGLTFNQAMAEITTSEDKAGAALQLFGKRGATAGLILAETTVQTADLEEKLNDANGAAKQMADTMLNNLAGDITVANSAWEGFILSLEDGSGVISKSLRGTTSLFTGLLNSLSALNEEGGSLGSMAEEQALTLAKLFGVLDDGVKTIKTSTGNIVLSEEEMFQATKNNAEAVELLREQLKGGDIDAARFQLGIEKLAAGFQRLTEAEKQEIIIAEKRANLDAAKNFEADQLAKQLVQEAVDAKDQERQDKQNAKTADKQRKLNEKIAADKISVQAKLQAQLDTMDIAAIEDDRERKEVELMSAFDKKIEAITGQSEIEKELKLRLAQELEDSLREQRAVWIELDLENKLTTIEEENAKKEEKRSSEIELAGIEAGEDLQKQREVNEQKRQQELSDETLTDEQRAAINAKYNAMDLALAKKQEQLKVQFAADSLNQLASLAKEGSDEQKALASAAAIMQTYLGATAAYAAGMQLGAPAGFIAAPLMAGVAIATGLANVAKINGVQFEKGGVLQGASHKEGGIPFTLDGQGGFEAEGGEAIMTKRAVEMFRPELSAMNQEGGGVAFERGSMLTRKFASGGAFASSSGVLSSQQNPANSNNLLQMADTIIEGFNDKEVINVATNTSDTANEVANISAEATF